MEVQEKDEKSFLIVRNLIKTEEKKYSQINTKATWHCDFNTLDLHVNIQSSWIMLTNPCLKMDSYIKGTTIILHYIHPVIRNSQLTLKNIKKKYTNPAHSFTTWAKPQGHQRLHSTWHIIIPNKPSQLGY